MAIIDTRTYFLYSDEGLIGEYDSLGTELRAYGYAPDSAFSTDPLFQKSGGAYYWYRNDQLGTPQKVTSTSGSVAWAGEYDTFGNVAITSQAGFTSNLRFGGQYFDAETGLYYNYNRYYDPTLGRYLQSDPYGDGINLYAYVYSNPNRMLDPMGLCAVNLVEDAAWQGLLTISNFVAGFGDLFTFGGTKWIRSRLNMALWDESDSVNYSSGTYLFGEIAGGVVGAIIVGSGTANLVKMGTKLGIQSSLVGAAIGAPIGAVNSLFNGGSVKQGAIVGALTGLVPGAALGSKILGNAVLGGIIGASTDFGNQVVNNLFAGRPALEKINSTSVVISAIAGGVGGGATGGAYKGGVKDSVTATLVGASLSGGVSMGLNASANSAPNMAP